jgi:hypothetical protein
MRNIEITITFWNKWVPIRRESVADGTSLFYFGFGRLTWRKKKPNNKEKSYDMAS